MKNGTKRIVKIVSITVGVMTIATTVVGFGVNYGSLQAKAESNKEKVKEVYEDLDITKKDVEYRSKNQIKIDTQQTTLLKQLENMTERMEKRQWDNGRRTDTN